MELEAVLLSVGGAVAFVCLITLLICLRNRRRNKVGVKVTFISIKCTYLHEMYKRCTGFYIFYISSDCNYKIELPVF